VREGEARPKRNGDRGQRRFDDGQEDDFTTVTKKKRLVKQLRVTCGATTVKSQKWSELKYKV